MLSIHLLYISLTSKLKGLLKIAIILDPLAKSNPSSLVIVYSLGINRLCRHQNIYVFAVPISASLLIK